MNRPTLADVALTVTEADEWGSWERPVTWREHLKRQAIDELLSWPEPRGIGRGLNDSAWALRTATGDFAATMGAGFVEWVGLATVSSILLESRNWLEATARLRAMIAGLSHGRRQYTERAWALAERLAPAIRVTPQAVYNLLGAPHTNS